LLARLDDRGEAVEQLVERPHLFDGEPALGELERGPAGVGQGAVEISGNWRRGSALQLPVVELRLPLHLLARSLRFFRLRVEETAFVREDGVSDTAGTTAPGNSHAAADRG
jgi:hypothetical protein